MHAEPPSPSVTLSDRAHLYGGPLDGRRIPIGPHTHGYVDQESDAVYAYCPFASAHFKNTTFTHSTIAHDAFSQ